MAIETEVKIRLDSAEAGLERLERSGFRTTGPREFESNRLYDTPDLGLRGRGEMVRIREVGGRGILTFKGKSQSVDHKVREELETAVKDSRVLAEILGKLGYHPIWTYEKYRTEFGVEGQSGHVLLDETPIGTFLELEGDPAWIDETAVRLGFSRPDYVTDSYGSLYAKYCIARGLAHTSMTFVSCLDKITLVP